jgi:hypothetical protein
VNVGHLKNVLLDNAHEHERRPTHSPAISDDPSSLG